ncbi:dynein light chain Tctex-type 5-B-like [Eucyclogobius newberryi]|uniref:dynein light chain Tctex-type 5-B-like n=1 Tax=Eucyclogobius newberryi TaxID=166745 RepID=UPI003B59CC11
MADVVKDKALKKEKKVRLPASDAGLKPKEGKPKPSLSALTIVEDSSLHDDTALPTENTYQLGPSKRHSVPVLTDILADVLTSHLQHKTYEYKWSREMTQTLCEVIRERVKELMIPRYKTIVEVNIGQVSGQGVQVSSRCLWDPNNDTFAVFSFQNTSLFCVAAVYVAYVE